MTNGLIRAEILRKGTRLNQKDIQILLGKSRQSAKKIYEKAIELDNAELGIYQTDNKARLKTVLTVEGITFSELERQIKFERWLEKEKADSDVSAAQK